MEKVFVVSKRIWYTEAGIRIYFNTYINGLIGIANNFETAEEIIKQYAQDNNLDLVCAEKGHYRTKGYNDLSCIVQSVDININEQPMNTRIGTEIFV
jgi:hypothetical protein